MTIHALVRRVLTAALVAAGIALWAAPPAHASGAFASCRVLTGAGCAAPDLELIGVQYVTLQAAAPLACDATFRIAEKNSGQILHSGVVPRGSRVESPYFLYGVVRLSIAQSCAGAWGSLQAKG